MWRIVILLLVGFLVIDVCWSMVSHRMRDEQWMRDLRRRERMRRRFE